MASKPEINQEDPVKKNVGGRPTWEPDEEDKAVVTALCTTGAPHTMISWYMKKDIKTLKKHFPEEFEMTTRVNKNEMVEYSLFYKAAYKYDTLAMITWLKFNMPEKYAEKKDVEIADLKEDIMAALAKRLPD